MRYRKLDAAGDYTLGSGQDFHVDTPQAVAQAVQTRLNLALGEWFIDTTDGMPWSTEVLGKYTANTRDSVIKDRILGTPGVVSIDDYSSQFDGSKRRLSVAASITTAYGAATVETTL
ncbi:MAG: hypothetical protein KGL90_15400 [Burkholderiales bacterium]|nr:hypothetical protein [Burkholderiales bacterium]